MVYTDDISFPHPPNSGTCAKRGAVENRPSAPHLSIDLLQLCRGRIVEDIRVHNRLIDFVKEFSDSLCSLELLLFFGRHPHARFNRTAVLRALATRRFDTAIALKLLIDRKLVVTYFENGITLYALTKDEPVYSIVAELKKIDRLHWQTLIEQAIKTGKAD